MKRIFTFLIIFLASLSFTTNAQVLFSSAGTAANPSAWLTVGNWTGGAVPSSTQIAQFAANPSTVVTTLSSPTVGINMNSATSTVGGPNSQAIGSIEVTSSRSSDLLISNSSTTKGGTLYILATSASPNVVIDNQGTGQLTIATILPLSTPTLAMTLNLPTTALFKGGTSSTTLLTCAVTGATTLLSNTSGKLKLNKTGGNTLPVTTNVSVTGGNLQISSNQTLNNLTVSGGSVTVDDGVTLTINGTLTLTSGNITLNTGNVIASTISGGSSSSYVVTNGSGTLTISTVGAATVFPIGASTMSYDKVTITNTTGTSSFSASVKPTFTSTNAPSDPTKVFSREWNITSASPSATLAFTPNVASTPSPAPTVVTLGHYVGAAWVESFATVNAGTYSGTFTSFSPFGVGQNGAFSGVVLGSELTRLTANANKLGNQLSWQTATEKNNAYFNIERSQNGETFSKIGQVKGNGTSSISNNYQFTDATPSTGINYYRLRQVDFDGTESVSKTVSVNFDGKGQNKFKVYPTLVQDNLTVELNGDGKSEITVRDLTGRAILTQNTEGPSTQVLNLGGFTNGLYILSVRSNDGFETVKIQKQ